MKWKLPLIGLGTLFLTTFVAILPMIVGDLDAKPSWGEFAIIGLVIFHILITVSTKLPKEKENDVSS